MMFALYAQCIYIIISRVAVKSKVNATYWSWGTMPGSAEDGVMGVMGPGVAGPRDVSWWDEPCWCIIGDIMCCWITNYILCVIGHVLYIGNKLCASWTSRVYITYCLPDYYFQKSRNCAEQYSSLHSTIKYLPYKINQLTFNANN